MKKQKQFFQHPDWYVRGAHKWEFQMKLDKIEESKERCAEAGWYAYDFIMDKPMEKEFIISLKPLGSFVYLPMLKKPFFKIEGSHYIIKGMEGDSFFRMAVHGDYLEEIRKVQDFIKVLPFTFF